ncbi:MAG TPA: DUF222 domain-containing protein [Acidimicrobiales bacterium]|nr:DUF222 domain-containing protein [Acidimicrobiales bacterium]
MPALDTSPTSTVTPSLGLSELAKMSNEELMELAAESARTMASSAGLIVLLSGELDRREGWRDEGATSLQSWMVERLGVSVPTARALAHVGDRLYDLPHLSAALIAGDVSFDKVRAVVDAATPESDDEFRDRAMEHSARELSQLARSRREATAETARAEYEARSLRFNESFRTVTAQLPAESFAEVRGTLEAQARDIPSDGETPWDQRLCDAFIGIVRSSRSPSHATRPFTVVAHVPLTTLLDETSELCGELEREGLISADTVRRVACDATVILAVDDNVGHTMYEGRRHRYPTATQRREIMRRDRHCRFPGCANAIFVNPHHIRWWKPHRGTTDLPNLVLLCEHHHHLVHSKQWSVSGNANEDLNFIGPTGRVMKSRPSPLWTTASRPQPTPLVPDDAG